jgi:hypothetical protein
MVLALENAKEKQENHTHLKKTVIKFVFLLT